MSISHKTYTAPPTKEMATVTAVESVADQLSALGIPLAQKNQILKPFKLGFQKGWDEHLAVTVEARQPTRDELNSVGLDGERKALQRVQDYIEVMKPDAEELKRFLEVETARVKKERDDLRYGIAS